MIYDFLVIGAGISGASAGYELSAKGSVIVVEGEASAGFHSTGRSAALYTPNYGPELVRLVNKKSYEFLSSLPEGFTEHSVLSPRGFMTVAQLGQNSDFKAMLRDTAAGVAELNVEEVLALAPFLRKDQLLGGAYEDGVFDMDVNAIHQGYLKGLRSRGGAVRVDCLVSSIQRVQSHWVIKAGVHELQARIVVNAAGAWADEVGRLAGAMPIGLIAKRRTAALLDAPPEITLDKVPAMDFMGCSNYIKPEKHQIMVSPGDETPVPAHDVQPDDIDVAVLVDWVESTTQISVNKVNHQWAGLRCFVKDGNPVVGFDSEIDDFFWLAGQGGYGIMMAPALARATAKLVVDRCLPSDFISTGIDAQSLSPSRTQA